MYWTKPTITLLTLALVTWLAPVDPIDPWDLMSPKKISTMIFALALIQVFGSILARYLGRRKGSLVTGFLGGLVSSTATTATLARSSKVQSDKNISGEMLTFLAATAAMLFEALAIVLTGTTETHTSTLIIFSGPVVATFGLIFMHYTSLKDWGEPLEASAFQILPLLKLAIFIIAILTVSKILQNFFGQNGLLVLTGLVSLFEIHGSVIANVQLHESEVISVQFLCGLLTLSIAASYISKLFLIFSLGSSELKTSAAQSTVVLFISLIISWMFANGV